VYKRQTLGHTADRIYRDIMKQREYLIKAFIAETGLRPSECECIYKTNKDGSQSFYIRKLDLSCEPVQYIEDED
jgi:hypothetical protein